MLLMPFFSKYEQFHYALFTQLANQLVVLLGCVADLRAGLDLFNADGTIDLSDEWANQVCELSTIAGGLAALKGVVFHGRAELHREDRQEDHMFGHDGCLTATCCGP